MLCHINATTLLFSAVHLHIELSEDSSDVCVCKDEDLFKESIEESK